MTASAASAAKATPRLVFLRSMLFTVVLWTSIILFAPLLLLTVPFPLRLRYRFAVLWTRFNLWWLGVTCGLRHRVEGLENIPAQPAIVMAKHQSAWETLALQLFFQPQVWILKRELLWLPFFGWGLMMLKPIAIDRNRGKQAVQRVVELGTTRLEEDGAWVVIFPEGTRIPPGERGRYRAGGALLAEHSGRPVVPVAHNAGEFWAKNGFLKYPGTIQLIIGPIIASEGLSAPEIIQRVEDWIEGAMERISRGARQ